MNLISRMSYIKSSGSGFIRHWGYTQPLSDDISGCSSAAWGAVPPSAATQPPHHLCTVLYTWYTLAEGLIPLFLLLTALKLDSRTSKAQYQADVRTCYNVQHTKAKEQSISIARCETHRQNLTSIVPVCVKKKKEWLSPVKRGETRETKQREQNLNIRDTLSKPGRRSRPDESHRDKKKKSETHSATKRAARPQHL